MRNPRLWMGGGIAGVVGIICWAVAVAIPWGETQAGTSLSLLAISGFPVLGIVYSYALRDFVGAERDGVANRLSFVFAVAAYTTLLAMIVVQLAVQASIGEITGGLDPLHARAVRRAVRMVDLGLDVTWDLLIGTALILWGAALRRRSGLGPGWAVPSALFGVALIGLNVATFPTPPVNAGLFDIGPFIALFMAALGARLALLGRREVKAAAAPA